MTDPADESKMEKNAQHIATNQTGEKTMQLTFIGKDPESNPTGSPTIYRTETGSWVVQGWVVDDADALAKMNIPEGETCVEIPDRMLQFFGQGDRGFDNR